MSKILPVVAHLKQFLIGSVKQIGRLLSDSLSLPIKAVIFWRQSPLSLSLSSCDAREAITDRPPRRKTKLQQSHHLRSCLVFTQRREGHVQIMAGVAAATETPNHLHILLCVRTPVLIKLCNLRGIRPYPGPRPSNTKTGYFFATLGLTPKP